MPNHTRIAELNRKGDTNPKVYGTEVRLKNNVELIGVHVWIRSVSQQTTKLMETVIGESQLQLSELALTD